MLWSRSSHTNLIDCQLNSTMRLVSGCLHPTQTQRLPVPSNIPSPNLRRQSAVDKMLCKIVNHQDWPVHTDVFSQASQRLSSRHPIWLDLSPVDMNSQWKEDWQSASVTNCALVEDPTSRQPGFDLPRCSWALLIRFRAGQGTCKASMYKWGLTKSPLCSCGDHGPYCELLSVDQVRRRSDDSTRSWRQCCQLVEFCGDYVSIREIINNCRETARRAESVKIWPTSAAQLLREKIAIEKGCDNWMTFSVTRGNRNNTPHWNVIYHAHASTHHSYSAHHTKFAISSFTISKGMIEFKSKKRVTYATLMMLFGSSLSCQGMWPIVQN